MENRKKVLIAEKVENEAIELLKSELDVDISFKIDRKELLERIKDYDALIVRSEPLVDRELMDAAHKLKVVGRAGNGIDNIDVAYATEKGIIVANTPDSNSISAAELAIGLLFAQSRLIPQANAYLKSGKWDRGIFKGNEFYKKTLGIIGLGRIGALVATRMAAFGMKVIAYDPYITDERFERYKVEKRETLEELLVESDFVTIHTPKTNETYKMISDSEIEKMKDGVRIVNAARGGIIDEEALLRGLKSGKIKSAGLDVHEVEPRYGGNPLYELDNVIVTPHIGATTDEAQLNVGMTVAQQIVNALKGEIVPNAVNLPTIHREELSVIKPYIEMMEKLGKVYHQLHQEPAEQVLIEYWGEIAQQDTEMVTIAFVKGLLEPVLLDKVNYINAMHQCEQRGIDVDTRKINKPHEGFTDLIVVKIRNKKGTFEISGNISSKKEGRLVDIQGYEVDVLLSNHMLFIQNIDVPGVIGNIGRVLGEQNINIASMQVGRHARGEKAMMVMNIDVEVTKENLNKLTEVENVIWAKGAKL